MTFSQPQCHEPVGTVRISILLTSYFEFQLYRNDTALHTRLVSFRRLQHRPRRSCDRCCGSCSFVHSLSMASRSPNRPGLREVVSRHAHTTTRDDLSLTMLKLNFLPEALPTFSNSPMHSFFSAHPSTWVVILTACQLMSSTRELLRQFLLPFICTVCMSVELQELLSKLRLK